MTTLFEIVKGWFTKPVDSSNESVDNPLNAKIGQFITIDLLDYRGKNFSITNIYKNEVTLDNKVYTFYDYVLNNSDELIRVVDNTIGRTMVIFHNVDDFPYSEEFYKVVTNESLKFVITDNDEEAVYTRVDDISFPYTTLVKDISNGKQHTIRYWDFWRDVVIDGLGRTEFLLVEINDYNGWITIRKGLEVEDFRVSVF